MLAKRRHLTLNGQQVERTPLLVPSFSSKGFPDINKIVEYSSQLIDGSALISAYDLYYKSITDPLTFPSLLFLDSGGYEASKDTELSDIGDREHSPREWTREMHESQLAALKPNVPTVLISFDSPKEKLNLSEQIKRAKDMAPTCKGFLREILLKPETPSQIRLHMKDVVPRIHALADFNVIGVTEKEVGNSIIDRMKNIATLRMALTKAGLETPIHVFGSLDTVTTPLYFLAGADIFDGLTWLRYAYYNGQTVYKQNFGALEIGASVNSDLVNARCWNWNYYYLRNLESEMRRFLNGNDFQAFQFHSDLFRKSLETIMEDLGG